jgi:exopolysaccharide biosynthesis predicted pyruvyltransferase EpsI
MIYRLDNSDEQRTRLFKEWLHQCPHGEFHSIENTWEDSATLGFTVDFAITRSEEDDL